MREKSKRNSIILLVLLLLVITVGYAVLSQNLNINGSSKLYNSTWDIHFENINVVEGSVELDENDNTLHAASIDSLDNTKVSFAIELDKPGSFYEFTVDVVNDGSIDAMIDTYSTIIKINDVDKTDDLPNWLSYSFSYYDDIPIAQNHLLASQKSEKYKVRLDFNKDISNSDFESAKSSIISLDFNVDYKQADSNAVVVVPDPVSFETDSWETITRAVHSGNTSLYNVGDTKTITLNIDLNNDNILEEHTYNIRLSNKSTPDECSTEDFSQTACGFVLEFVEIITNHNMNDENINVGGWFASDMREYINNDLFNSLPIFLKKHIIDTKVLSGKHTSSYKPDIIESIDKLYLLAPKEIGFDMTIDSIKDKTRILDYYNINNNNSSRIKKYNGSNRHWWTRDVFAGGFTAVEYTGFISSGNGFVSTVSDGVSPAFRLG